MLKSLMLASVVAIVTAFATGQTSADLGAKYPTVSAYEVRPGI